MLRTDHIIAGAALAAALVSSTATLAASDRQWQTFIHHQEGGDTQALLVFGTPNSDDVVIAAECSSEDPGQIVMDLLIDLGPNEPGGRSTAHFGVADVLYHFNATVHDSEFVPYGRVILTSDDALWAALQAAETGEVPLFYAEATEFAMDGADTAVAEFVAECGATAAETPR